MATDEGRGNSTHGGYLDRVLGEFLLHVTTVLSSVLDKDLDHGRLATTARTVQEAD